MKPYINWKSDTSPHLNADVVYRSRAILKNFEDIVFYDDDSICDHNPDSLNKAGGGMRAPEIVIDSNITVEMAPNPADNYTTLTFSDLPSENILFRISTMEGLPVLEETVLLTSTDYVLNIPPSVTNGIYLVQVILKDSNIQIFSGQLQILRE